MRKNNEEKKQWKDGDTSEEWKLENLNKIKSRMQGWQLSTFEDSIIKLIKEFHFIKKLLGG